MKFLNRDAELSRLDRLAGRRGGGLAVVYGRRRVGKTRLLLHWCDRHDGLYTVADQSSADIQRRYFAQVAARRLPSFADVDYPDWRSLLARLAAEARASRWRGPIVFDELPYLVLTSPEIPSVLQHWIDHDARRAGLVVAVAGSSQRMMQALTLSADAPLFGRARELLELAPLDGVYLAQALGTRRIGDLIEHYAAWGGIPRYWELAAEESGPPVQRVERLVLDPLGPLHREPDRLLLEEIPSAVEVRPLLDAIGGGAHRVSEIAGRIGRPATSMSRPLDRLVGMGLVRREVPFGESEKKSRRSLYKIGDPFFRLWFRVVAPNRATLASGTTRTRLDLLAGFWPALMASSWEELCRWRLPRQRRSTALARSGPWGPAGRWWKGGMAEWDIVARSTDGRRLLLGEAKWSTKPFTNRSLATAIRALVAKPIPDLPAKYKKLEVVRALCVPEIAQGVRRRQADCLVVTGRDLL
jgi:AAA+ ATPase superfamily predicted ATPase